MSALGATRPPPLLLVPGMLCDSALFDDIRDLLDAPTVDAVVSAPTITAMAEQVLAAAPPTFVLCGLSLGAIVGFEVARLAPARLAGFCAMSTNASAPSAAQYAAWATASERVRAGEFGSVVRESIAPTMFRSKNSSSAMVRRFFDMAERVGPDQFVAQLAAQATRVNAIPALTELACPALILSATEDALCPSGFHELIAGAIPNSRLETVTDCGHLCTWERPDRVAARINDWLATDVAAHLKTEEIPCPPL